MFDLDLTDKERELLRCGLREWGGPARCTEAMAVAMGFNSVPEVLSRGEHTAVRIQQRQNLTAADWQRAILATEIAFISDVFGSGVEWSITTGFSDEETLPLLRSVQRKLARTEGFSRQIPRMPSRVDFLAVGRKFTLIQTPTDDIRRASLSVTLDDTHSWQIEVPGWRPVAVGMSGSVAHAWSARSVIVLPADPVQGPEVLSVDDEDIVLAFRTGEQWLLVCETSVRLVARSGEQTSRVELSEVVESAVFDGRYLHTADVNGNGCRLEVQGSQLLVQGNKP
ncbi:hypothetical protein [Paenarthrobacter sp. NPDC090522]|uniref:hypothetical protein n=1 Tax=Paenarthrobacter sp. NPDC090522 TaxID=3364383 RepID=UPI0038035580